MMNDSGKQWLKNEPEKTNCLTYKFAHIWGSHTLAPHSGCNASSLLSVLLKNYISSKITFIMIL
jgi:hypothetical protein